MATTTPTRRKQLAANAHGARQAKPETDTDAVRKLLGRLHGETASSERVSRLATVSSEHLRDVTALLKASVSHFNKELAQTPTPRNRRRT